MGALVLLILGVVVAVVGLLGLVRGPASGGARPLSGVITLAGLGIAALAVVPMVAPEEESYAWVGKIEPSAWAILSWLALVIFVAGVSYRIAAWMTTPVPLSIPTTPAPTTTGGVILRVLGEVLLHRSLIRDSKYLWVLSMLFHWSLLFILLRHLRYFIYPVWDWVVWIETAGIYGGYVMPVCLLLILMRRMYHLKQIYISLLSDYVALLLLLGITGTGVLMADYVRVDLLKVKNFAYCLSTLTVPAQEAMPSAMFLVHFMLVLLLVAYFPLSKLLHVGGATFSPSRAAKYDIKNRRYVNPWDPGPNVFETYGDQGGGQDKG
jgi:nitrate reductase gamma subunit